MTFFVSLSVKEKLERLSQSSAMTGRYSEAYFLRTEDGKQIVSTLYRKMYLRSKRDYLVIQAVLDDLTGTTRVHFSESYNKKQDFDFASLPELDERGFIGFDSTRSVNSIDDPKPHVKEDFTN